ncbi:DUF4845 domain-containing protein [Niveibacterium sp. SC-1]|uniref:DUF4845 domain-containing protein n=1 Tax=Niveibacterium sp. SC-1 TaxID=3135646 RepID=UPI00311F78C1
MLQRQRGISLIGTLIIAVLIIGAIIMAMRMVPVYNEYFAVKRALNVIATSSEAQSPEAIRGAFNRKASVEDISTIKGQDLSITKENGRYVIEAEWERRIDLVSNVSLVFSFRASSAASGGDN